MPKGTVQCSSCVCARLVIKGVLEEDKTRANVLNLQTTRGRVGCSSIYCLRGVSRELALHRLFLASCPGSGIEWPPMLLAGRDKACTEYCAVLRAKQSMTVKTTFENPSSPSRL